MNILLYALGVWPIDDAVLQPTHHHIERIQGELTDLVKVVSVRHPDLVLLTSFEQAHGFLEELEGLCAALPHATIGVYIPQAKPELLVEMMRAGVRDVFTDCQALTLQHVLDRAAQRIENAKPIQSRVLGLISGKGGDGGSCVAANLAYALAHMDQGRGSEIRVLLIDLSLPFGDLEMYLTNQQDIKDLADISAEADRLDFSLLNNMVHHVTPTLDLIVSPTSLDKVVRIESEPIRKLIHIAARHYSFVVLDLGSAMGQISLSVLDQLDEVFLIGSPALTSIKRTRQIITSLQELELADDKISIVINRCDQKSAITHHEIETVIGKPTRCLLPLEEEGIQDSLLRGKTIMALKPDSKFSQALNELASEMTGVSIRKKSLWQRLRKK
jgi:pilus assembly protein CpaE